MLLRYMANIINIPGKPSRIKSRVVMLKRFEDSEFEKDKKAMNDQGKGEETYKYIGGGGIYAPPHAFRSQKIPHAE